MIFALALVSALSGPAAHLGLGHGEWSNVRIDHGRDYRIVTSPDGSSEWVASEHGSLIEVDTRTLNVTRHALHTEVGGLRVPFDTYDFVFSASGRIYLENNLNPPDCGIGELNQNGGVKIHTSPSHDCADGGLTLGPDQNVWFMERQHVAEIAGDGTIKEYALPANRSGYESPIATGSDANIWFVENGGVGDQIFARLDVHTDLITEFQGVNFCYVIDRLVLAHDGRLYAACANITNLGNPATIFSIDTSGYVSYFDDSTFGYGGGIAAAPSDTLVLAGGTYPDGLERFDRKQPGYIEFFLSPIGMSDVAMGADGIVWSIGSGPNPGKRRPAYGYLAAYRL